MNNEEKIISMLDYSVSRNSQTLDNLCTIQQEMNERAARILDSLKRRKALLEGDSENE